jgi:REP element-mobilizing transposase RayT
LVHSLCKSPYMESPGDELEGGISPDMTPLGDILSNVPPPNPLAGNEIRNMPAFRLSATERPDLETYSDGAGDPQPQIDPTRFETNIPAGSLDQTVESLTVTRKSKSRRPEVDPLDETRPRPIVEFARKMVLEPTAAGLYNLDYACLLIPRFNHHHLTGDLSDRISEYVPQICIAFAWRLEYISVRPEYLQWIANVPPATSPAYLMRILRQHTSDKIFAEFPQYKKDNPSGDFWAPGYLIMGGSQPPPAQLIKDYINQTRVRQGIYQPTK